MNTIKEMLDKKTWAVVGATDDESKYGYKIFKNLITRGYNVYGVNPKYDEIDGQKIYKSLKDINDKIDCVSVIVNPKIALKTLDEIKDLGIKYVWFQPGSFNDEVINKAKEYNLEIVNNACLYIEM